MALLGILGVGYWFGKPRLQTSTQTTQKRTKTAKIAKNIVKTTLETFPDGKTVKTQILDTSTIQSDQTSSTVAFSLTALPPLIQYGVSVGFDPFQREMWYGGEYRLLGPVWLGVDTNLKDRVILGGSIKF